MDVETTVETAARILDCKPEHLHDDLVKFLRELSDLWDYEQRHNAEANTVLMAIVVWSKLNPGHPRVDRRRVPWRGTRRKR